MHQRQSGLRRRSVGKDRPRPGIDHGQPLPPRQRPQGADATVRKNLRIVFFRPCDTGINIKRSQSGVLSVSVEISNGVREFKMKAGLADRPRPVVARHVPVKLIPLGEAAEMVADLIANFVVIDPGFQDPFAAANAYRQFFFCFVKAKRLRHAIARHRLDRVIHAKDLAVLTVPGQRQRTENPPPNLPAQRKYFDIFSHLHTTVRVKARPGIEREDMFIRWNSASGKLGSILDDDHVAGGKSRADVQKQQQDEGAQPPKK